MPRYSTSKTTVFSQLTGTLAADQLPSAYYKGWEYITHSAPTSDAATITLALSSTYKRYLLCWQALANDSGVSTTTGTAVFNSDTGNNYGFTKRYTTDSDTITRSTSQANFPFTVLRALAASAANACGGEMFFQKTSASDFGFYHSWSHWGTSSGNQEIQQVTGTWQNAADSLTSITLTPGAGQWYANHCKFYVYGARD